MRLTAAGARLAAKAAGILEGARRLKEDVAGEPEVPRGERPRTASPMIWRW
jgi:DNA-binding transcriptional LysR family regulator